MSGNHIVKEIHKYLKEGAEKWRKDRDNPNSHIANSYDFKTGCIVALDMAEEFTKA